MFYVTIYHSPEREQNENLSRLGCICVGVVVLRCVVAGNDASKQTKDMTMCYQKFVTATAALCFMIEHRGIYKQMHSRKIDGTWFVYWQS